jgi:hypothetical protein
MSEFVRSTSTEMPHLVRWASIPETSKAPLGPYRQAPPEFGGEWFFVNPFTGKTPWDKLTPVPPAEMPEGFAELFGEERPSRKDDRLKGVTERALDTLQILWDRELKYFKRAGTPPDATAEELATADSLFTAWDMGSPSYYEGQHGWRAVFKDCLLPGWSCPAGSVLGDFAGHMIVRYQIDVVQAGLTPVKIHDWFPAGVSG